MVECGGLQIHFWKEIVGSNPTSRANLYASLVQLVEYLFAKQEVAGSNPAVRSSRCLKY